MANGDYQWGAAEDQREGGASSSQGRIHDRLVKGHQMLGHRWPVCESAIPAVCVKRSGTRHFLAQSHMVCFAPLHTPYRKLAN